MREPLILPRWNSTKKIRTFQHDEFGGELLVQADNTDDSEAEALANPAQAVSTGKSSESTGMISLSRFGGNWMGCNDRAEFRILNLVDTGSYTVPLPQLDKNATGAFHIRKTCYDGKTRTVFSLSGSSSKDKEKVYVLLGAGTYLIFFESESWKNGRNTELCGDSLRHNFR